LSTDRRHDGRSPPAARRRHAGDTPQVGPLIEGLPVKEVMADTT